MKGTRWDAFRLSSKGCSTRESLRRLHARGEAALRNARNLHRAAGKALDSTALQSLEEELKQIPAARKLIYYAIHARLANLYPQTRDDRSAA